MFLEIITAIVVITWIKILVRSNIEKKMNVYYISDDNTINNSTIILGSY